MKGLLLKDWYQVRTSMKAMYLTVAFVLVWVFSTSSAYVFPVSYAAVFLGIFYVVPLVIFILTAIYVVLDAINEVNLIRKGDKAQ